MSVEAYGIVTTAASQQKDVKAVETSRIPGNTFGK
jgi:hypothetical protein